MTAAVSHLMHTNESDLLGHACTRPCLHTGKRQNGNTSMFYANKFRHGESKT